jgi:RHS repeat-associated protein
MSRYRSPIQVVLVCLLALGLLAPVMAALWPAQAAEQAPPAAPISLLSADGSLSSTTVTLVPGAITPEMVQVIAGQAITFQNDDSQTRRLVLGTGAGAGYRVFLPMVVDDSPAGKVSSMLQPAAADEMIILAPGESVSRTFNVPGNIVATDADDESLTATLLVVPPPQPQDGPIIGQVIDYSTKLPISGAQVRTLDGAFAATTNADGEFDLNLPPGEHVVVLFANGYSFANRAVTIRPFTPATVETIELVPLDPAVTAIGNDGGTAENSTGNTSVVFSAGAVGSTVAVRLTDLPVDEHTGDFAALPGPFTDGHIPLGFVMFEPDGTNFSADAVWTIEYDGGLPVGTYVPCFYWIEEEARWGEPVDGQVVDLGNGQKGLRATLPHFSSYGFSAPPPPQPKPPELSPDTYVPEIDDPAGPEDNPNESDQDQCIGSMINLASGELCQTIGTVALPALGGTPTQITARYFSRDVNYQAKVHATFEPALFSATPDEVRWWFGVAGRVYGGSSYTANVSWDGVDGRNRPAAPGRHMGLLIARFGFNVSSAGGGSGGPPGNCGGSCGMSYLETEIDWPVSVVHNDLSPFGIGWFSPYDELLVDAVEWVTIIQGDGRQVVFIHEGEGLYSTPPAENSSLVKNSDGTWTRTYRNGAVMSFNADGRLTRLEDRYGNFQQIFYESNGKVVPPGQWGLNTRIRRIVDTSGNRFDYGYDGAGWLSTITDHLGRVYSLEHNAAGHLTAFTDPLGQRREFTYDAQGMMTGHKDRRDNTTTYVLDGEGRLLSRTWPTGTSLTAVYAQNEVSVTSDNGSPIVTTLDQYGNTVAQFNGVFTVRMQYDDDLRPTLTDRPNALLLYDEEGRIIESVIHVHSLYERDGPYNQISQMTTSSGLDTHFGYDAQGNLTSITDVLGQSYAITYDSHGQALTITDPLGNTSVYTYDGRGRLASVTDPLGRSWQLHYDAAGNLVEATDPGGGTSTMSFDELNRLTEFIDALGGVTEQSFDANDNLTQVGDPTGRVTGYTYDELDRLLGITHPDGGIDQFAYDGNGNPTIHTDARGLQTTWGYDAANRPVSISVEADGAYAYSYDEVGQPTSITVEADDGTGLRTGITYINGIAGYPIHETQVGDDLPLTWTIDYAYGGLPYMRDLGHPVTAAPEALVADYMEQNGRVWPEVATAVACSTTLPTTITESMTLDDTGGAYCFGTGGAATTTLIEPGVTLTAEAGVTLAGYPTSILEVQGTLILSGTAESPVVLTAQSGTASIGNYRVLVTNSGHVELHHAETWYGGYCDFTCHAQIKLEDDSSGLVRDSHLGLGTGTFKVLHVIDQASLAIHDSTLADPGLINARGTLHVDSTGTLSVTNSLILQMGNQSNISTKGVRVNERNVAGVLNGANTFVPSEGHPSRVYITSTSGGLLQDALWKGLDQSVGLDGLYFYSSLLIIRNGATLTIEGPQDILPMYWWNVGDGAVTGHLRLVGAPGKEVRIARPSATYSGINVNQGSSLYAEHAVIGYSVSNNVVVNGVGATVTLSNTQVLNGAGHGIYVSQGSLDVHGSLIANNGQHGIYHFFGSTGITVSNSAFVGNGGTGINNTQSQQMTIEATHNFWGAATGPSHIANPGGTGQAVTNGVDYYPWMATPGDGRLSGVQLISEGNAPQLTGLAYDLLGRVVRFDSSGYAAYSAAYEYDANDRLLARTPIAGLVITDTFTYDAANQLLDLNVATAAESVLGYTFSHDANGNVSAILAAGDGQIEYAYDALHRLVGATGWGLNESYGYDGAGNRISANGVTYTYDAGGRLTASSDGVTYTYDDAGYLLSRTQGGQTTTYQWNGRGQLVRIEYAGGAFSAYRYDDAGRRISRRLPDGTTIYYTYINDMLAQELDADGNVLASYTYDGLDWPVSLWRNGETFYYVLDHLGSVRALVDSSGVVTATYSYDPWGNVLSATGTVENPLRFAAREYDAESELYYNRFRYYDPRVGRFISRDPLGIRGGLNPYVYANNNPVTWRDEWGLQPRVVFQLFKEGKTKVIDVASEMRNLMRNLRYRDPDGAPIVIWTNADEATAKNLSRMTGAINCVDEGLPYIRVRNRNGKEVAQMIYGRPMATTLGAVFGPLSGLGAISEAVSGNGGPLAETVDMLLGLLMPGMMTVDPSVINPGSGIPQT